MQIVTVANAKPAASYMCFDAMLASCRRFGHEPLILGWGQPWGGLGNKPRLLLKAIESGQITDDHILFLDAFDTVLARPPCDIMAAYAEYDAPIVWGAERNLFPDIGCDRDAVFPASLGGFRYLNSGVCVAQTDAMLAALRQIGAADIPDDHKSADGTHDVNPNDQEIWLRAFAERRFLHGVVSGRISAPTGFLMNPEWLAAKHEAETRQFPDTRQIPNMALDTECRIALNMHSVTPDDLDLSGERIKVLATGAESCVVHFPGDSKTNGMMPTVLRKLGLH